MSSDTEALDVFLHSPVTQDMIHHLVNVTLQVLPCESAKTITQQLPTPPNSPPVYKKKPLPSLMTFITKLVRYTNVYTGTLMSTIVYMNRLKTRLPKDAQGMACTRHRIFLACLIIAAKNFNDSSPKNKHWSKYTDGLFRREDVNLMERQLLMLLDWDLRIETKELTTVWRRFLEPIKSDLRRQSRIRKSIAQGTLACSTQTVCVPPSTPKRTATRSPSTCTSVSASSSMSSISSVLDDSTHSRSSSVSSMHSICAADDDAMRHKRGGSISSLSSMSYKNQNQPLVAQQPQDYTYQLQPAFNAGYHQKTDLATMQSHNVGCGQQAGFTGYELTNYLDSCAAREQRQLSDMIRQYCGY